MRLGEILIERRLISQEDLDRALELQKDRGDKLAAAKADPGLIDRIAAPLLKASAAAAPRACVESVRAAVT